jgi:molecular chaperone HtpG
VFRERKLEVLFLYDPWDEFVMDHLHLFEGKSMKAAEKAELQVKDPPQREGALSPEAAKSLAEWLKQSLGDQVGEVRVSQRLVDSPAVVVDSDKFMTATMRRMMRSMKREGSDSMPERHDLEINPSHSMMIGLEQMRQKDAELASKVAEQIVDNARVAAGILEDPRVMLKRLNQLLERVLTPR